MSSHEEAGELSRIEVKGYFLAGTEDGEAVVECGEQRENVAVARVCAGLARVRAGAADFFVDILHVTGRLIFNLTRITVEAEVGVHERNGCETDVSVLLGVVSVLSASRALFGAVDEDVVPVNLQVGRDPNSLRAGGQFAGEVSSDGARAASGKAHVIDHANPLAVRPLSLDVRPDGLNARLISGVHAGRHEVFDLTVHQQDERAATVRLAEIEFEGVQFGEALEGQDFKIAHVAMREQVG